MDMKQVQVFCELVKYFSVRVSFESNAKSCPHWVPHAHTLTREDTQTQKKECKRTKYETKVDNV